MTEVDPGLADSLEAFNVLWFSGAAACGRARTAGRPDVSGRDDWRLRRPSWGARQAGSSPSRGTGAGAIT
ncbi:hypothetical protein F1D05_34270 [Kribbella qitaiheensis]|uniref:Uncharacterized protein n=1 Tax=Kribbella qitaiheensis TaxID=1544730 RepID=A0A7G6X740_9ACTN|nr:hypothetical protein F1D05_34270 [Kribbella qitaiheensis]